jgi:hypothetical protein
MWRSSTRSLDLEIYLSIYRVIYLVIDASLASSVSFFSFNTLIARIARKLIRGPEPVNIAGMACQP